MPRIHVCSLARIDETVADNRRALDGDAAQSRHAASCGRAAIAPERHLYIARRRHRRGRSRAICCRPIRMCANCSISSAAWDRAAPLLIHCFAGVSRSTAAAFIAACALSPRRDEGEIARALRAASPTATPNARLVALADATLGARRPHDPRDRGNRPRRGMLRGRALRAGDRVRRTSWGRDRR